MGQTLRRIAAMWRPHRGTGFVLLFTMLLQTVFAVVLALALKLVIDGVVDDSKNIDAGPVVLLLVAGFVVSAGAGVAAEYLSAAAGARIMADLRTAAFDHLQRLSMGFHVGSHIGDLLARFSTDMAELWQGAVTGPLKGVKSLAALALYLPVMILLDWRLALLALGLMPLALYAAMHFSPDSDAALDDEKLRIAGVLDEVHENLDGQPVIRAFGLRDRSGARFREQIDRLQASTIRAWFRVGLLAVVARFAVALVQLFIVGVGAVLALNGNLEAGALAGFVALLTRFTWEVTTIGSQVIPEIKASGAGMRRVSELLEAGPVLEEPAVKQAAPDLSGDIEFDKVIFSYSEDGERQLDGVSLVIPAGSSVAIVGPSGSGKSTLLSLLLRFYDPQAGTVSINGTNLGDVNRDELRSGLGVVFQDTFLFDATLEENIKLADPTATPEDVENAAALAGLGNMVAGLPVGFNTVIGPKGQRLSGGQRQRVGIARAILRQPPLLLLDEVTSALDPATEADVNATLQGFRGGRTIVSVTHRLQSVTGADLIVVLRDGVVTESGTFEELKNAAGTFAEMWEKQSGFTISGDGRGARVSQERLKAIPLFSELSEELLEELRDQLVSDHHEQDELVFEQGAPADRFYVIARGVVEVVVSEGEKETVIAHLEDGDFFGEMALLDDAPRNASIRAVTSTVTLSLSRDEFDRLLAKSSQAEASVRAIARSRAEDNQPLGGFRSG